LVTRLKNAESVALIDVQTVQRNTVTFRTVHTLKGAALSRAQMLPGHRLPSRARRGLATFRRIQGRWTLQEQGREWIELAPKPRSRTNLKAWRDWLKQLTTAPHQTLIASLNGPFERIAVRDLNALMLQPKQTTLRQKVLRYLVQGKGDAAQRASLKRHMLAGANIKERARLVRCLADPKACVGR
jgi:hypothetical protein